MEVKAFGATDVGKVRAANEDSFLLDEELKLYIVADGMGGHQGGGYASSRAVAQIKAEILRQEGKQESTQPLSAASGRTPAQIRLKSALLLTNEMLFKKAMEDSTLRGMGTTVTAIQLDHVVANIAHVGDSRLYLMRNGDLLQISRDHSWVQEQVDAGVLSEEEARVHPLKNIITRSLGHDRELIVDLDRREYQPGDRFMLCSDGLTNMVDDETIKQVMRGKDLEASVKELIRLALEAGGQDNITTLIVEIRE
ncbi:MAG TPA: Stp1/IreP family PP2C-type Ser/Thr phosphatase [bacterium]|nr:Stp1/IreP family PP2C-type Ser/Thr phosphatase [bacterium]